MMIPLRSSVESRRWPVVTISLLALNLVVFCFELVLGSDPAEFLREAAVIPALYGAGSQGVHWLRVLGSALEPELLLRILLSTFLHAGFLHILGNLVFLWLFGIGVEDRVGAVRFLGLYLVCGWFAMVAHILSAPASQVPCLGASGAIAGVLGASLILYPGARIAVLLPSGILHVPALLFLTVWFAAQAFSGLLAVGDATAEGGGTAWWAHVAGFAVGAAGGAGAWWLGRRQGASR
jgi:membrane associated rhomboid family serine protease